MVSAFDRYEAAKEDYSIASYNNSSMLAFTYAGPFGGAFLAEQALESGHDVLSMAAIAGGIAIGGLSCVVRKRLAIPQLTDSQAHLSDTIRSINQLEDKE